MTALPNELARHRNTITMEVCIDSLDSAIKASQYMRPGDRFEVCSSLIYGGGLTPSVGLISELRRRLPDVPLMAMIRPRTGSFTYTEYELDVMVADIQAFKSMGVAGVVFGCLLPDGQIDLYSTTRLVDTASPLPVTFHRAFDLTPDWKKALRDLESIGGIDRILTSGHAPTALEGAAEIAEMVKNSTITILPGSGVDASTLPELLRIAQVSEVHLTASGKVEPKPSTAFRKGQRLGFGGDEWRLDVEKLKAVRDVLDSM